MKSLWQGGGAFARDTHARLNHACAFAEAADADNFSAECEFHRDLFWPSVARHNRFGGVIRVLDRISEKFCGFENSALHIFHRHRDADAPGRSNKNAPGGKS